MQAIILAAGMGKRLKELTEHNTKCMVKVGSITLIERMLSQLDRKNLSRIVIVVGFEGQKLKDFIGTLSIKTPVTFVNNPIYDRTNNIYSLALAKEWLRAEDTVLLESDLIFDEAVLDVLLSDPRDTLALVDKYEPWMDGTCVKLNGENHIVEFVTGSMFRFNEAGEYYKTVNVYKFGRQFSETYYIPALEAYLKALGENEYYEQVLRVIVMLNHSVIQAKRLSGQKWYEIDDIQDLDIAESLFATRAEERVKLIQNRFGGYWRYPKMLDFCYLVNPFFPPKKMTNEMETSFGSLLTSYPSGMRVNSLLAAKCFGVHCENIAVGNGASELIKSLMGVFSGKTGFVKPTFEEYPRRFNPNDSVFYVPANEDYSYRADNLMEFFADRDVNNLVLINPDNPSGNYIPKIEMINLVEWCKRKNINLLVDESFVDFCDEGNATLIEQRFLSENPHLYVVKSISKSYGVPGIRLGVLVSGDVERISVVKKEVPIWNVNSVGEFFLQILGKYQLEYEESLIRLRKERVRMQAQLARIQGVRVIPSQANYVMVQTDLDAAELTEKLLLDYNIFVKNLYEKTQGRNFLRVAIRTPEENDRLLDALKCITTSYECR